MSFDADLGPVDYLVVTFDSTPLPAAGFDALVAAAQAGTILLLDVEFVARAADGAVTRPDAASVGLPTLAGASSGVLDAEDVEVVADSLAPGQTAAVVVYENLAILPAVRAWQQEGGTVVAEGPVVLDDLIAALDATERS